MSSYTVEAILKARDSGFSSAFKNAEKSVSGLTGMAGKVGSAFKSVLGANLVSSALTSGIRAVTSGLGGMVGELNSSQKAWKTFEGNLQAFGRSPEVIKAAKTEMQDFATKTIYSASDMASTYSQLDAVGTKNVGSLVKAFGGLAASAENPAQAMKSLSTQATQMASKPKVAWMDFKIMMEQAPAGMAAVAKEMGMSTAELVSAVQDGKISTEEFFDAMNRAGNSDAFQKMATEFKTVDQAIDGAKESLANKLMPSFDVLNKFGIKAINAISDALEKIKFDKLASSLEGVLNKINIEAVIGKISSTISSVAGKVKTFWSAFANTGAVSAFLSAMQSIGGALGHVFNSLTSSGILSTLGTALGSIVKWLSQAATMAGNFIQGLSPGTIQGIAGAILGVVGGVAALSLGFKGLNFIKSFNPFSLFRKNAETGMSGVTQAVSGAKSTIAQVLQGLANVIRSIGSSVSVAARGIGAGLATAFRGIASAISMLNPVGVASFALGVAAVTAALVALSSVQGMVLPFLQGLADILVSLVGGVLQAFATALITLQPVMITIATALSMLSPLIVAVGQAFAAAAPFVTALGEVVTNIVSVIVEALPSIITAISGLVTAIAGGVAQIITAITPIVQIISDTFVQVVTVVTQAIVQIVQALAPFIPELTAMVQAVAPVLEGIVSAFDNLISQISPIIDSITNLFKTLGEQISSILESAGGVIESFGSSVRNILDGIAGIFESMGNAAKNAGQGVKLTAQGIKMLVDLKLGDLVATLTATATGLGAMAGHASGMATLGTAMTQVGTGMTMFATGSVVAVTAMTAFGTAITVLQTSLTQLPALMTTAAAGFSSFTAQAVAGVSGLSAINGPITDFKAQLMTITPALLSATVGFTGFSTGAMAVGGALGVIGGLVATLAMRFTAVSSASTSMASSFTVASSSANSMSSAISSGVSRATSAVRSGMSQMVSIVRSSASQLTAAGRQAGTGVANGVTSGIRGGIGSATAAMSAMMSAVQSAGMAGVGAMQSVGAYIGQGLAAGMMSALGAVTAAANALVAQAERAARTKAQIHSPARLFRDRVGIFIGQGVAVGIDKSTKYVNRAMDSMFDGIDRFNGQVSDMMGGNLAYSFDTGRYSSSVEVTYRRHDAEEMGVIKEALHTIKDLVSRDVVLNVDSQEVARTTGDAMTDYQNDKKQLEDLMRGLK